MYNNGLMIERLNLVLNFTKSSYKSLMKDSKPPTATHGRYRSLPKGLTSLSFDFFVIIIKINYLRSSSMPKAWLPSSPQGAITIICRTELCNPSEKLTPFRQNLCEYIFHNPWLRWNRHKTWVGKTIKSKSWVGQSLLLPLALFASPKTTRAKTSITAKKFHHRHFCYTCRDKYRG